MCIGLVALAAAGCGGGSALKGSLEWRKPPAAFNDPGGGKTVAGFVRNTTGHSVDLDVRQMRLLDAEGRKVRGRIQVKRARLAPHEATPLVATWKSGKPVRIDYGTGALALPSK
jgi:hypothetical protein